ncbi:MAG: hypothetical protein HQ522_16125 [Bacteroidetes bacterium]|nr:hypothetical protein [Bacteroidota bacterium]
MSDTTVNSMNLHLEKSDVMISAKVPNRMRTLIKSVAHDLNMSDSQYIKLAIKDRLEKDLEKK